MDDAEAVNKALKHASAAVNGADSASKVSTQSAIPIGTTFCTPDFQSTKNSVPDLSWDEYRIDGTCPKERTKQSPTNQANTGEPDDIQSKETDHQPNHSLVQMPETDAIMKWSPEGHPLTLVTSSEIIEKV